MKILFILIIYTNALTVFEEYNNRSKQAQRELLIEHLKRQNSLRLLGKVAGSSLSYNEIIQGLIKQNTIEAQEGKVSEKKFKQLIDDRNKEVEQKRMELLRRLAQNEIDSDQAKLNELKRSALVATTSTNTIDFTELQKTIEKKWRAQRKALIMLERARDAKNIALLEQSRNQQSPSYSSKKRAEFHFKVAQKRNKIATKAISRAQTANQKETLLILKKQAEIKNFALKNAKNVLKETSRKIKKFNIRDNLI
ncbi:hypothetical protein ENUP19_0247G0026 [Entamoeba nuttalli]|uniref:Uncharacterized protein n=2 Tax=Entamoeba nuttalli TaxID=412467 RepID=K2GFC9_ENTNP|nr:hypothetical protein ENU1_058220 [Entamoeba nuttalli P19]EKE41371.1 hypothetical protein ENU1_058220 [Entamoeba nuttalli P19]|eukprot:XP_008856292.1 hypothetical protein ENU1_058220 [Entamoeba nuttalli P19]